MSTATGSLARFGLIALLALALGALLLFSASPAGAQSGSGTVDYDTDGDNLIEVSNLAQLNAIRYDLDGNGTVASGDQANYDIAFPNAVASMGCAATCTGYELEADLDFNTDTGSDSGGAAVIDAADDYYNIGSGWEPLGDSGPSPFRTTFNGNNHTISNLFINRTGSSDNYIGLFGQLGGATVTRVHLVDAKVTGNNDVGALVGHITLGTVSHSSSSGTVSGVGKVGGLVGAINSNRGTVEYSRSSAVVTATGIGVGGLVGSSSGLVRASYATGAVTGRGDVGGLSGYSSTSFYAVYATGAVTATGVSNASAGGLVGGSEGGIYASYSTGAVTSASGHAGGLLKPSGSGASVGHSYWDVTTTSIADDNNADTGEGKTTLQLQSPTQTNGYAGIYANWDIDVDSDSNVDDPWDFGTASQYPALKADSDGDGRATAYEFGRQGRSAPAVTVDYDDDDDGLIEVVDLDQLNAMRWDLDGDGAPDVANANDYALAFPNPATGMGCPITATDADDNDCLGYELTADLDFNTDTTGSSAAVVDSSDDYWNGGLGWSPIGSETAPYMAVFDGGRHTIANLFINRPTSNMVNFRDANKSNYVGLFASLMSPGEVRHLRLTGVSVTGRGNVGAVVGHITLGKVSHVSSTGAVTAVGSSGGDGQKAGGLVGSTGANTTVIEYSYSTATVTAGDDYAGGLVGESKGEIRASYATGAATATGSYAGGLVGKNDGSGIIKASYATGAASGADYVGGLVGRANGHIFYSYSRGAASSTSSPVGTSLGGLVGSWSGAGTITNSYWDVTTSGIADDSDAATGEGMTTSELQSPQAYGSGAAIYADWNVDVDNADNDDTKTTGADDPWDFGTASQYPALKADFNRDGTSSAADDDFGRQPRSAPVAQSADVDYDANDDGLIEVSSIAQLHATRWNPDGDGDPIAANADDYALAFPTPATGMGCVLTDHDSDAASPDQPTCTGYELTADLDFDEDGDGVITAGDAAYWNEGLGWDPLGVDATGERFTATFDGKGHRISNLYINRPAETDVGLWTTLGDGAAVVRNLGVERASVTGVENVGVIVGSLDGTLEMVYATGSVRAARSATGSAKGSSAGGLAGYMATNAATIRDSYANVAVTADVTQAGGLVGSGLGNWEISRSYARGRVSSAGLTGGVIARAFWFFSGTTADNYWDTESSGQAVADEHSSVTAFSTGKTTAELQAPVDTTSDMDGATVGVQNIYANWDAAKWDFGTNSQYPALKFDTDKSGGATSAEFGSQSRAALTTAPVFADGASKTLTVPENTRAGVAISGSPTATDADAGDWLTYALEGADAAHFVIHRATGQISTKTVLDYETDTQKQVRVVATDSTGRTAGIDVNIDVTNVNEGATDSVDYDTDDDGLIEVDSLEKLDAMRYDLDGDGVSTDAAYLAVFTTPTEGLGCPNAVCRGYELDTDLTFDSNSDGTVDVSDHSGDWWDSGAGWAPIGTDTNGERYTAAFEGNGHTISRLFIARSAATSIGLFGAIGMDGAIENVGLENVDVTGAYDVGALAGTAAGASVKAVYATGSITGSASVGGLIGSNAATTMERSYSTATVTGSGNNVGGLMGGVIDTMSRRPNVIRASYSTGAVSGDGAVGGLIGRMQLAAVGNNRLVAVYAAGAVSGNSNVGGLIGVKSTGQLTVTDSYWDVTTSGIADDSDPTTGVGKTTRDLQMPAQTDGYAGIYANWNLNLDGDASTDDDPWDFGTDSEYPALKVEWDGDGTPSAYEFGRQGRSAPNQPPAFDADTLTLSVPENTAAGVNIGSPVLATDPDGDPLYYDVIGDEIVYFTFDADTNQIKTRFVLDHESKTSYSFSILTDDGSGGFPALVDVTINVTNVVEGATDSVDYDSDDNGLIEVGSLDQLDAMRHDLDGDGVSINAAYFSNNFTTPAAGMGCPVTDHDSDANTPDQPTCTGYELTADLDFDTHGNDDTVTAADAAYWNGGSGWDPIGSSSAPFAATFDGAGHAIANLFINRGSTDYIGLFRVVGDGGRIRNLGLERVKITGRDFIGAVAGEMSAFSGVEAVYVTGAVSGRDLIGGLIGEHHPNASLRNTYSAARVTGSSYVGGLLGYVPSSNATVYYSYARGVVTGRNSGGLLYPSADQYGINGHQTYWDTQTSGQATSNGGTGQTTSNLKTPTDTTTDMDASTVGNQNIYSSWPVATWDFGTASQYPALKYDTDGDGAASWQEFGRQRRSAPVVAPGTVDYDTDDDGLIEVDSLVKLNAVRWDLDGNGASANAGYATAFPNPETGMGCPITATDADDNDCTGYELTADLDFDQNNDNRITSADAAWWNGGSGWEPIGGNSLASVTWGYPGFTATFQGNGHTISHLYIDRPGRNAVGLFGATKGRNSVIRNLTLADVNVASKRNVGALVGSSWGSIEGVHVSGRVSGDRAGGLVGQLSGRASRSHSEAVVTGGSAGNRLVSFGGLVSVLTGSVESSYATGSVTGTHNVGGLVGFMDEDGRVSRCYATGDVTVSVTNGGGLIGLNNSGSISACYATGEVSGNGNIAGGLVGLSRNPSDNRGAIVASYARGRVTATGSRTGGLGGKGGASVTNSYWDVTTSGIADDNNAATGEGKATSELQSPTQTNGYAGIYANWNLDLDGDANTDDDPWDFGTTSEYPALKADFNDDGISTWQEFGRQRRSAPVVQPPVVAPGTVDYDTDGDNLIEVDSLAKLNAMRWDADGDGAGGGSDYDAAFPDAAPGMGCPSDCTGYELEADLNFDTNGRVGADSGDDYWNGGMGWAPFWYYGTFEGNRHTISNLYVNRPNQDYVGLFSTAGAYAEASEVRNVGLENVDVTGREYVGGLAGRAYGSVRRVYTTGEVNGEHYVGGLVGEARSLISETYSKADVSGDGWESSNVGGLVGYLRLGTVKASYATGDVSGMNWVGGLVGHNSSLDDGGIIASYATGNLGFGGLEDADPPPGRWVDGFSSRYYLPYTPTWVGGLVGDSSGPIAASYSTGGHPISLAGFQPGERKDRSRRDLAYMMEVHWKIGGLVGKSYGRDEHDSYWDIVTSRHRPGDKDWVYGKGKTTEELQWVTGYTGIYADWNVDLDGDGFGDDPWDFGSSAHYPTLKVDWNGDGTATSYEFGGQGRSLNDHVPPVAVGGTGMFEVTVPENTPSGAPIFGVTLPLAPADASSYNLFVDAQWPDGVSFNIDATTGQLSAMDALDYESRDTYRIGITAVATDGARHSNGIIIRVTDVAEPPGPPTGVTIVSRKGSLEVSWTAPDMAGKPPLRIYEVTYYHDGDKAKITAAGTTTYTMTHLTPLITYAVQVRARNVDGWGPDSAVAYGTPYWFAPSAAATGAEPGTQRFRRSAPPPGQPANLRATPQEDGSALVTWDAPAEAGDDAFYRVRRRVDAADGSYQVIARRVEAADSGGVVAYRDDGNGREAGQRYLYSVRAFDGDGKPLGRWTQGVRDNRPPAFTEDSATAFQVAENTASGTDIGDPVAATDPDDGDSLTYLLGGADADHFAIDADSGQLRTSGALDYESQDSYAVTVIAADGAGLWAGLDVTITVTDVQEAPAFASSALEVSVAENTAAGTDIGDPVTATDSDGDALTYSLGSTAAAGHFTIDSSSGQLQTSGALDYESTDSYTVTVTATDGGGLSASIDVTIKVDDMEETGRPGNVQAALQSDGSALITWDAPAGAGADTFYRVRRRVDTADSGYQVIARRVEDTDNDGDAEYRDEGGDLEAGQSYIYSVRALAGSGAKLGPWTEGVSVAIPAAAPAEKEKRAANNPPSFPAASTAVSVAENTASGTNIGDAVAATDSDGDSLTYTLGTTTDDAHFAIDSKTGQLQTSGALDYESKDSYTVTVTATDGPGLTASIAVTITVDDVADTPPGQPDAPEISNIKETSFRITWTAPAAGSSAISGYGIQYKLSSEADSAYADAKPTKRGTVTGYNLVDRNGQSITAGTSYDVRVRARNAEGWGEWSEAATVTTASPAPPPNNPPSFASSTLEVSVAENTASSTDIGTAVTATDPDVGDTLTYTLGNTADDGHFAIDSNSGQLQTSGALDYENQSSYAVRVPTR